MFVESNVNKGITLFLLHISMYMLRLCAIKSVTVLTSVTIFMETKCGFCGSNLLVSL